MSLNLDLDSFLTCPGYETLPVEDERILSDDDIVEIFNTVGDVFIFQGDNVRNVYDLFMSQLNSRASRSSFYVALTTIHRDYVGTSSNYRKWLKAACKQDGSDGPERIIKNENINTACKMYVTEVALYLLIWGEASNIRFMPECICFIYKCCLDYYMAEDRITIAKPFLDHTIVPLFEFLREQQYKLKDGNWIRRRRDHARIIGYDDMNLFFWYNENLQKLVVDSGRLYDMAALDRYPCFDKIDWNKAFFKSYREVRTWSHLLTNFSRVWITHLTMFWYFTSCNSLSLYTKEYSPEYDNTPPPHVIWSVVSLGGVLASTIALVSCMMELRFVPRKFPGAPSVLGRSLLLMALLALNLGPSFYLLWILPADVYSRSGHLIGIIQFGISAATFLYLVLVPPAQYFSCILPSQPNSHHAFTSDFQKLPTRTKAVSASLWVLVFTLKFLESYFFLTLSVKDPVKVLSHLRMTRCHGDSILGTLSCRYQPTITLAFIFVTDLVLFFLDTYLWYVLCTCMLSIVIAIKNGNSIFTLWKSVFSQLPERLISKTVNVDSVGDAIVAASHMWNAIVYSMYRDHLISVDQASALMYQLPDTDFVQSSADVKAPINFFSHNHAIHSDEYFPQLGEAKRRISYFAQSLSSPLCNADFTTDACPAFTVLIPHYSESILLSIEEVIRRSKQTQITLLDYLKSLLSSDWTNFVRDTRVADDEKFGYRFPIPLTSEGTTDYDNLPYEYYGFKFADPESTLRTRIWASLRSQTLYRTVSGFMNYRHALAELYKAEHEDCINHIHHLTFEDELKALIESKFTLLVSIQRHSKFSESEMQSFEIMAQNFPTMKISVLEEIKEGDKLVHYCSLLDLAKKDESSQYGRKFKIRLPGYPILGDGKSDNQNTSAVFYRGEYIQVVDSNQDNYLEECLKIKSMLSEFEELNLAPVRGTSMTRPPVAIVGAREYIFSEQVGALGDIAAGKEQTFGTMFGRALAFMEGKLHYGHPDFVNGIFMCTRGGLSKAQRSLHLNEDIYAGMNAIARGGRIKHADYFQCGKGRDLGFNTILNFTSKIGAGMAEQTLSREQFYFGTRLPTDRLFSFFYAHVGFHINNVLIILSIHLFLIFLFNIGSLRNESIVCDTTSGLTEPTPIGCYNIKPAIDWISRYVLSVIICFFLSFTPLVMQEFIERGVLKTAKRIFFHLISLSPLFEVFVCQVYASAFVDNRSYGGARYISTGRGYAISRISFATLYSRYASLSIYWGSRLSLIIIFACSTVWQISLLWFWITCLSLCLSPFIFNPHQFDRTEFFLDYREYLRWLGRGNFSRCRNSWVRHVRFQIIKLTGLKGPGSNELEDLVHPISKFRFAIWNLAKAILNVLSFLAPYMFLNSQNGVAEPSKVNPLMRVAVIVAIPLISNIIILVVLFGISILLGSMIRNKRFADTIAAVAHIWSILAHVIVIEITWYIHSWNLPRSLACICLVITIQRYLMKLVLSMCISKESDRLEANSAWWSGRWIQHHLGWHILSQPFRELGLKLVELNFFAFDFLLGHVLFCCLSTMLFIPYIGQLHSLMMFWFVRHNSLNVSGTQHLHSRQRKRQRKQAWRYFFVFIGILVGISALLVAPYLLRKYWEFLDKSIPTFAQPLFQPSNQDQNDTGPRAPSSFWSKKPPPATWSTIW